MSTVLTQTPAETTTAPARESWRAIFALARFESRKLLLRIPVLFMLAAYVAWIVWRTKGDWNGYPALQDVDRATQTGPLLVGFAVLLCVNQSVLRSQRHDTERLFGVLVLEPWRRTAAHALSILPVTGLVALGVAAQFGRQAVKSTAVGHGSMGELLVGPLCVLLCGAIGLLMARLVPKPFAIPVAAVLLLVFSVLAPVSIGGGATAWLTPIVGEGSTKTIPSDLIGRPAASHALYLTGLALALALLAVLISKGRTKTSTAVLAGSLAGAIALGVVGGIGQAAGVSSETVAARTVATLNPQKVQSCVRHGRSTYCAFPEWVPRTATWAEVTDHVQSLAGGTAQIQKLLVQQRVEARYGMEADGAIDPSTAPNQVTVRTMWGGPRTPEFSAAVASVLVLGNEKAGGDVCDGRMVTIMWLALGWTSDPVTELRAVRLDDSVTGSASVLSPTNGMTMTAGQTSVVRELLAEGPSTVTPKVKAHWAELISPKVTTAKVAQLLGVKAPSGADKCE
ncbi:ABC transporter permease [Streptomyces sp. W16]|uniref:ABC transporter permease n=1 Tax=Streptomyces sp. W16 TaxID=3076631 RepID=UPI00295A7E04|nr:ABC transporter permease [Streptomyces sp. W16]MDV9175543.1 ABC transporter permease [Streptomyces sp. W16]